MIFPRRRRPRPAAPPRPAGPPPAPAGTTACRAGGGREVRTEVEGLGVRREEHRHRPAAVPGGRLHRLHVHGVDVRAFLAVHLDADEVRVHVVGGGLVLEGLVGHHVAPVAAGVADAQQHRHIAPPRLGEGLLGPGPPVHGVVGVLEEVGDVACASRFAMPPSSRTPAARRGTDAAPARRAAPGGSRAPRRHGGRGPLPCEGIVTARPLIAAPSRRGPAAAHS